MRILLVEDHYAFGKRVKGFLTQAGYAVDWVRSGLEADAAYWAAEHPDLVILDLDVPGLIWRDWIKTFKKLAQDIPVLALTGNDDAMDVLNAGVDSHLSKRFFKSGKLLAETRTLLRQAVGQSASNTLTVKDITINLDSHTVMKDNVTITLHRREFALLHKLMTQAGKVVSRHQLMQCLYGEQEAEIESNTIEVHISMLRRQLGNDTIKTLRGVGYMITGE